MIANIAPSETDSSYYMEWVWLPVLASTLPKYSRAFADGYKAGFEGRGQDVCTLRPGRARELWLDAWAVGLWRRSRSWQQG